MSFSLWTTIGKIYHKSYPEKPKLNWTIFRSTNTLLNIIRIAPFTYFMWNSFTSSQTVGNAVLFRLKYMRTAEGDKFWILARIFILRKENKEISFNIRFSSLKESFGNVILHHKTNPIVHISHTSYCLTFVIFLYVTRFLTIG